MARRRPASPGHACAARRRRLHRLPVLRARPARRQQGGRAPLPRVGDRPRRAARCAGARRFQAALGRIARLVSRHGSSAGLRWPSKRVAALQRLPIRSVLAAGSLGHLIRDATLVSRHRSSAGLRWPSKRSAALQRLPIRSVCLYWLRAAPCPALRWRRAARDLLPMKRHSPHTAFFPPVVVRSCSRSPAMSSASRVPHLARLAIAAAWLAALALPPASADPLPARNGFPSQTVKFISPFPPGGGNDATARLVTTRLPEIMGQAAVVDNRGGAGGNIGAKAVAESRPDGYTVLASQVSIMAVNPVLYASAGFDPVKNFVPITQI